MYSMGNCENSVLLGCSLDLRYCASCLTSHLLVASSKKNKIDLKDLIYVCGQHLIFSLKLLSICSIPQLPAAPSLSDDLNPTQQRKWTPSAENPLISCHQPPVVPESKPIALLPTHRTVFSCALKAQGFRTRLPYLARSLRNPFHCLPATALQGQMLCSLPKAHELVQLKGSLLSYKEQKQACQTLLPQSPVPSSLSLVLLASHRVFI